MPGSERRYGILIANQNYPEKSGFQTLACPERDVAALRDVLLDPDHGEFDKVDIIANKTRSEILIALEEVLQAASRDDLVFIYFSGHGKLDRKGNLFFAAANTRADRLRATGVNASDLSEIILDSTVRKKALVLDCCYAGAFARNWKSAADIMQDRVEAFSRGAGTYVLMATDELSLAEEDSDAGISVFTKHLVDGLRGAADANRDGIITLTELSNYVHAQVVDQHNQRPIEAGLQKRDEIAISKSGLMMNPAMRTAVRAKLIAWADAGEINDRLLSDALRVLASVGDGSVTEADRPYCRLLERMLGTQSGAGAFVYEWVNTRVPEHPEQEPPAAEEPPAPVQSAQTQKEFETSAAPEIALKGGADQPDASPSHIEELLKRFERLEKTISEPPKAPGGTTRNGGALPSILLIFAGFAIAGITGAIFEAADFPDSYARPDQNGFTGTAIVFFVLVVIFLRRSRSSRRQTSTAKAINMFGVILNFSGVAGSIALLLS